MLGACEVLQGQAPADNPSPTPGPLCCADAARPATGRCCTRGQAQPHRAPPPLPAAPASSDAAISSHPMSNKKKCGRRGGGALPQPQEPSTSASAQSQTKKRCSCREGELCRGRADGGINDSTVGTLWSQSRDNPVRTRGAFQSCLHWGPAKSTSGQRRGAWLTSGQAEAEGKGTTQCGVRHTPAQGRALGPAAATGGGWGPTVRDNLWPVLVPVTPGRYIF